MRNLNSNSRSYSNTISFSSLQSVDNAKEFFLPKIPNKPSSLSPSKNKEKFIQLDSKNFLPKNKENKTEPSSEANALSSKSPVSLPQIKLNEKFFKLNHKIISLSNKPKKRNKRGKTIDMNVLSEICKKQEELSVKEKYDSVCCHLEPNFISQKEIPNNTEKFSKFLKSKIKTLKQITNDNLDLKQLSEEQFLNLISKFQKSKLEKSPILMKYFESKNVNLIFGRMGKFIYEMIFGSYEKVNSNFEFLENIHKSLNISNEDFDLFKGLLIISLKENDFKEEDFQFFIEAIEKLRYHITKKLGFDQICLHKNAKLEDFIYELHENIKENGVLSHLFAKMSDETAFIHHKNLFTNICSGYHKYSLAKKNHQKNLKIHSNVGITWKECFEMKNTILNTLLDKKTLDFPKGFHNFQQNLHYLHKYILAEPNLYHPIFENSNSFDYEFFYDLFLHFLRKTKSFNLFFSSFSKEKLQKHAEYILDFITKSPKNSFDLVDLIPEHCKIHINDQDFFEVMNALALTLNEMKLNNDQYSRLMLNFERTRGYISRNESFLVKKGGSEFVDRLIENIYVSIVGSQETKKFFVDVDTEYVKYKQKIFFSRLFRNQIDGVDLVDLKAIHEKLGIQNKHFDDFLRFSSESLFAQGLSPKQISFVIEKIEFFRHFICQNNYQNNK